jgi:hypothetical protein
MHYVSKRIRSRGSPGLTWAPESRKTTEQSRAGFIFLDPLVEGHAQPIEKFYQKPIWEVQTAFPLQSAPHLDWWLSRKEEAV